MARTGCWSGQNKITGDEITGQTLGIVGLGHTGAELVRLVAPFNMRVLAYSPHADPEKAKALGVQLVPTIDEIFGESDFVSLHSRLEPHTRRMIGEREFRMMKPTAYFINVARGELVRQEEMVHALREHWIRGAALDVFEEEPLPASDPLVALDNVILTPHWLPATRQAGLATMTSVANGMRLIAAGKIPGHVLNPEVLERQTFREKLARLAQ